MAGTLSAELQPFITHLQVERRLAARTLAMYTEALLRLQASAAAEGVALQAAQPHHIRGWMARLRHAGLGPRSIAIALAAWRGLYRWWGRDGRVPANPVQGLRPPRAPKPLPKALSVDQAVALAEHAGGGDDPVLRARDHAIVELLYGCGLRVGELTGLNVAASGPSGPSGPGGPGGAKGAAHGWVDLMDATAHVTGKGSKRRSVPVGNAALLALRAWLALRGALLQPGRPDEPALFISRRGTRLSDDQLRTRLKAQALQAGVPAAVHPHMLRHSYASHLLQSSSDLRAVQELLGHASISSTQVYTRLDFQHLAKAYDAAHPRARRRELSRPDADTHADPDPDPDSDSDPDSGTDAKPAAGALTP